jgi:hypothetical protein
MRRDGGVCKVLHCDHQATKSGGGMETKPDGWHSLGCSFDYVETVAGAALHGRTSRQLQNLLAEIGRH